MARNESPPNGDADAGEQLDDWEDGISDDSQSEHGAVTKGNPNGLAHENDSNGPTDEHEIEDGSEDDDTKVLTTYRDLLSRRVDLVGDYAGDELFLIDGDSLLLRCFSDERLDFETGFQLLHAVYNVEHFLHQLTKRKCNFHIVFFDCIKECCIPPASDPANASKYLLARAIIIRHLQASLLSTHTDITVQEFASYDSAEFVAYLKASSPYFLMAHDGALDKRSSVKTTQKSRRVSLRRMICHHIQSGYNIALLNGLEWRDTKVMATVLEPLHRGATFLKLPSLDIQQSNGQSSISLGSYTNKLQSSIPQLSERELLTVLVIAKLREHVPARLPHEQWSRFSSAFALHQALLAHLPLSSRRLDASKVPKDAQAFVLDVSSTATDILQCQEWTKIASELRDEHDLNDFIDGRLLLRTMSGEISPGSATLETYHNLIEAVKQACDEELTPPISSSADDKTTQNGVSASEKDHDLAVLPFSNPVFDKHLASIRLKIDEDESLHPTPASTNVFREVTHWHNAKKPLIQRGQPTAVSEKQASREARRNQMFLDEMQKYSASLTNAVGRSLEPETIIVGQPFSGPSVRTPASNQRSASPSQASTDSEDTESTSSKSKGQAKKGGGKNAQQNARKQAMLTNIAASQAKKGEAAGDKIVKSWQEVCKDFDSDANPKSRYTKARSYLTKRDKTTLDVVGAECSLYMVSALLDYWIEACRRKQKQQNLEVCALIWSHLRTICESSSATEECISNAQLTAKTLSLPPIPPRAVDALPQRKLAFTFSLPSKVESLSVDKESKEFQLQHCGPYLERSFDSAPDSRVEFMPDGWQREVLNGIDADKSLFVVAPTSAGKTFISFYAMRKVLEADDDGILVYVAPTKALVNQIAAEIQARYSKKFKYGGKSVWAIHTRDYRINNPTGCQVLVTVPHVLQIMLLAPTNANSWSSRVKRIIFDEVHSIGQAEDGVVWEQLLLMAPSPVICLSATVGNPTEFSDWLKTTQDAIGIELLTVEHPYRYSDLRKYFYVAPETFKFSGVPEKIAFASLGIRTIGLNHVHPVAGLIDKSRGIPDDLALEPMDCHQLWQAMTKHQIDEYSVPEELNPKKALPEISKKSDILRWERNLKKLLRSWLAAPKSPYDKVVAELEQSFIDPKREAVQETRTSNDEAKALKLSDPYDVEQTTLPLLCRLQEQDALPAIFFNYDRHACEKICRSILETLEDSELKQQKTGAKWQKTLEKWEEWKKVQEKNASKKSKAATTKKAGSKSKEDDDEKGANSKLSQQKDAGETEVSQWESFNPDAALENYHFADYTKVQLSEMEIYVKQLKRRQIEQWLIEALQRGIGIHHAGMNRKYRQIVEILFRKGFLRVVIATGTLALGINMPCKTVVFSGDSVFLTALNYRQCAGRAGRRGFDLLGNVVFQGISREKVSRLISSRLPDLNGHFPITTTLVLRLFTLLTESKNSKFAEMCINSLLSQPRLYMGGPSFKDQTMHHLRFSIEYLRRQHLLGSNGVPLNFAGLVSHLYFTENSSFAFHALLKEGYFHELCGNISKNETNTLETLMLVMAHLFNRTYCRQADEEYRETVVKPSSSVVFLPPLPKKAANILRDHNQETLEVYRKYCDTFSRQHISHDDDKLPLSGLTIGGDGEEMHEVKSLPPTHIRSAFVALSGAGDEFASISDLCQTTRDGIFLEEAVVPHIGLFPEDTGQPLNAWLLDFYKHGDVHTLERANKIRRSDVWFMLNDFSLVLATIIASLMNFMKLKEDSGLDMLDIMGDLDAHEEGEDDKVAELQSQDDAKPDFGQVEMPERTKVVPKKKAKNTDSWEEVADEEEASIQKSAARNEAKVAREEALNGDKPAWEGEGLKDVLKAFVKLHAEFTIKFKAMWA